MSQPPFSKFFFLSSDDAIEVIRMLDRITDLQKQIIQQPYPNGPILMDMISRAFPEMSQKAIFHCVQHIKQYITQQNMIAALQKQNVQFN